MKHKNNRYSIYRTAGLAFLTLLALPAGAVTVLNPSFESDVLGDGSFISPADSWTAINVGGLGGGAYNPDATNFTGAAASGTPTGADGINVYSTNAGIATGQTGASQTLIGTGLTANTLYTLTVAVGDYLALTPGTWNLGISTSSMAFGSYLSTTSGTASSLTDDSFKDFSVSYTATGLETQNTEDLKITFWQAGTGVAPSTVSQFIPFDNVRFDAVLIPEPSATLLGGLGLLFMFRRRRN